MLYYVSLYYSIGALELEPQLGELRQLAQAGLAVREGAARREPRVAQEEPYNILTILGYTQFITYYVN